MTRQTKPRGLGGRIALAAAAPLACLFLAGGCGSEFDPPPNSHPGDAALKDPMGYKVSVPSVSGGGESTGFDDKVLKKEKKSDK